MRTVIERTPARARSCDNATSGTFNSFASPLARARSATLPAGAIQRASPTGHQLQVIDDDQIRVFCSAASRRALARISRTDIPGVSSRKIFVSRRDAERLRNLRPLEPRKEAVAKALRVDVALRTEHAHHERLFRHFDENTPTTAPA
jgi:hypothetical protein